MCSAFQEDIIAGVVNWSQHLKVIRKWLCGDQLVKMLLKNSENFECDCGKIK